MHTGTLTHTHTHTHTCTHTHTLTCTLTYWPSFCGAADPLTKDAAELVLEWVLPPCVGRHCSHEMN